MASTNGTIDIDIASAIDLKPLRKEIIEVPIVGVTPVIPHKWSEKAKRMMRDKQTGKAIPKKEPKDPAQEAADATYWLPDGRPGMPAVAFKAAIASAARHFEGVTMTALKEATFVRGEGADQLVPIDGDITMREDTPRNASGVADLRYRNQIWPWSTVLTIEFLASALTAEAIVALVDAAGMGGVGDWRPSAPKSKTGTYGRFQVAEGVL